MDVNTKIENIKNIIKNFSPQYFYYKTEKNIKSQVYSLNYFEENTAGLQDFYLYHKKTQPILNGNIYLLLSTSGSTGSSKFAKISKNNIFSNTREIVRYLNIDKNDSTLTNLPMNYSYGLSIVNSHFNAGASIILSNKSIIDRQTISLVKKNKITNFNGVPSTYEMIFRFNLQNIYLKNLKYITQAGGPLSEEIYNKVNNFSSKNKSKFFIMYGQTEASPRMSYLIANKLIYKKGMIGKPIKGGKFHISDKYKKEIKIPNKVGKLHYQGANVFLGYANSTRQMNKKSNLQNKIILDTGDLAKFDDNKNYYIVGRESSFIKLLDKRVNLEEISDLIKKHNQEIICTYENKKINIWYTNKNLDKSFVLNIIKKYTSLVSKNFNFLHIKEFPKNSSGKVLFKELKSKNETLR